MTYGPGTDTGHGHVWPRPDGAKARCGGPRLCVKCARDRALYQPTTDGGSPMPNVQTTRTTKLAGGGEGPTLAELRAFLDSATDWADTSTVRFASSRGDQREGSSWRLELTETASMPTRSRR